VKNYCRSCDECVIVCSKDCVKSAGATVYMLEHRIYLWSPEGVLAIPDLDIFFEGSR